MPVSVEISGASQLRAVAGQLERASAATNRRLQARMQTVGVPMKAAVQRNALAIPTHGDTATGLRRAIAAATKIRTTVTPLAVTVRVEVVPSAMPPGQRKLPTLMEGPGWTHEVFGTGAKVFQPGHAYFKSAVDPLMPAMRAAIEQAVTDAARSI